MRFIYWTFLVICWIGIILYNYPTLYSPKIEVGQIWERCHGDEDDPFKGRECWKYKVIEVKAGYVKYSRGFDATSIDSANVDYFLRHHNLTKID